MLPTRGWPPARRSMQHICCFLKQGSSLDTRSGIGWLTVPQIVERREVERYRDNCERDAEPNEFDEDSPRQTDVQDVLNRDQRFLPLIVVIHSYSLAAHRWTPLVHGEWSTRI